MNNIKQYTDEKLFGMGMWNCLECGHINSVDHHRCDKCLQDKFIMTENRLPRWKDAKFMNELPELPESKYITPMEYSNGAAKKVYDLSTGKTYRSMMEASQQMGVSYGVIYSQLVRRKNHDSTLIFVK
jgi:hypothetical protein